MQKREKLSERQPLHAVKRGFQVFNADGAGDAEVARAAYAEGRAGADEDVCLLQQHFAELFFVKSGFLNAGEEVEGTLRADEAEVGNLFDPVGGVKDAVLVCGNVFFADFSAHGKRLNRRAL